MASPEHAHVIRNLADWTAFETTRSFVAVQRLIFDGVAAADTGMLQRTAWLQQAPLVRLDIRNCAAPKLDDSDRAVWCKQLREMPKLRELALDCRREGADWVFSLLPGCFCSDSRMHTLHLKLGDTLPTSQCWYSIADHVVHLTVECQRPLALSRWFETFRPISLHPTDPGFVRKTWLFLRELTLGGRWMTPQNITALLRCAKPGFRNRPLVSFHCEVSDPHKGKEVECTVPDTRRMATDGRRFWRALECDVCGWEHADDTCGFLPFARETYPRDRLLFQSGLNEQRKNRAEDLRYPFLDEYDDATRTDEILTPTQIEEKEQNELAELAKENTTPRSLNVFSVLYDDELVPLPPPPPKPSADPVFLVPRSRTPTNPATTASTASSSTSVTRPPRTNSVAINPPLLHWSISSYKPISLGRDPICGTLHGYRSAAQVFAWSTDAEGGRLWNQWRHAVESDSRAAAFLPQGVSVIQDAATGSQISLTALRIGALRALGFFTRSDAELVGWKDIDAAALTAISKIFIPALTYDSVEGGLLLAVAATTLQPHPGCTAVVVPQDVAQASDANPLMSKPHATVYEAVVGFESVVVKRIALLCGAYDRNRSNARIFHPWMAYEQERRALLFLTPIAQRRTAVVQIHDVRSGYDLSNAMAYIVTDNLTPIVEGSHRKCVQLARLRHLPIQTSVKWIISSAIADALATIHLAGWCHGDAHKENIFFDLNRSSVRFIDFDLALHHNDLPWMTPVQTRNANTTDVLDEAVLNPVLDNPLYDVMTVAAHLSSLDTIPTAGSSTPALDAMSYALLFLEAYAKRMAADMVGAARVLRLKLWFAQAKSLEVILSTHERVHKLRNSQLLAAHYALRLLTCEPIPLCESRPPSGHWWGIEAQEDYELVWNRLQKSRLPNTPQSVGQKQDLSPYLRYFIRKDGRPDSPMIRFTSDQERLVKRLLTLSKPEGDDKNAPNDGVSARGLFAAPDRIADRNTRIDPSGSEIDRRDEAVNKHYYRDFAALEAKQKDPKGESMAWSSVEKLKPQIYLRGDAASHTAFGSVVAELRFLSVTHALSGFEQLIQYAPSVDGKQWTISTQKPSGVQLSTLVRDCDTAEMQLSSALQLHLAASMVDRLTALHSAGLAHGDPRLTRWVFDLVTHRLTLIDGYHSTSLSLEDILLRSAFTPKDGLNGSLKQMDYMILAMDLEKHKLYFAAEVMFDLIPLQIMAHRNTAVFQDRTEFWAQLHAITKSYVFASWDLAQYDRRMSHRQVADLQSLLCCALGDRFDRDKRTRSLDPAFGGRMTTRDWEYARRLIVSENLKPKFRSRVLQAYIDHYLAQFSAAAHDFESRYRQRFATALQAAENFDLSRDTSYPPAKPA